MMWSIVLYGLMTTLSERWPHWSQWKLLSLHLVSGKAFVCTHLYLSCVCVCRGIEAVLQGWCFRTYSKSSNHLDKQKATVAGKKTRKNRWISNINYRQCWPVVPHTMAGPSHPGVADWSWHSWSENSTASQGLSSECERRASERASVGSYEWKITHNRSPLSFKVKQNGSIWALSLWKIGGAEIGREHARGQANQPSDKYTIRGTKLMSNRLNGELERDWVPIKRLLQSSLAL